MTRSERPAVQVGDIWWDRDKRMLSVNRRVRVLSAVPFGFVEYRNVAGSNDVEMGPVYRSRYDRFRHAFDLLSRRPEEAQG